MAKYILLVNWTEQGIRNIKDSAKRLDAGRALAKEQGCVPSAAALPCRS